MFSITDHPQRHELANELHARPFPALRAPCHAVYLALKPAKQAAQRDRGRDMEQLCALLDHYAAPHPQPDATHYSGKIGRHLLKWESHTEFVTYTVFTDGLTDRAFDPAAFDVFPGDWVNRFAMTRITSLHIRTEALTKTDSDAAIEAKLTSWFVNESLAASRVVDDNAIIAGDFRIDEAGHMRFALFVRPGTGALRIGRIVQRLTEIETYKAMSMLALPRARALSVRMTAIDTQLSTVVAEMTDPDTQAEKTLNALLSISAELEQQLAENSFRFGATTAYEALVTQRIAVLREARFGAAQTFGEFMMRRFDPAMRTARSTERRLRELAARAMQAGDLLRTRVDVERSAQNQALLTSMDSRAALQLRLQETVEGLSVVAISYYAVNLAAYIAAPFAEPVGLSKTVLIAGLTPVTLLVVWGFVRRIRHNIG